MNPKFGRLRLRLVLALGCLLATPCFAGVPLDTVRDCATTASAALAGVKALGAVCPELPAALGTLGLDTMLYEGWQDKLNVHALHDLIDLSERYSGHPSPGPPDASAVPGILQALKNEQVPLVSWWQSLKNWIKKWIEHSDSSIAKWLKHLFENVLDTSHVSPAFLQAFVYVVTVLTALAAIVVIIRELKAAGIGSRVRRGRSALNSAQSSVETSPADEEAIADEHTPAGLLRALVKRLVQTGRLRAERSLTHRELIARTSFDSDVQKSIFADVARTAETILYGSEPATPEYLQSVTRQGRDLLLQLSESARLA